MEVCRSDKSPSVREQRQGQVLGLGAGWVGAHPWV